MRIGRADHAELEWVRADLLLILEAALERLARILAREHVRCVNGSPKATLVPSFEIGELILGREHWVRFTVAFHLGNFVDRLPAHPA